MHQCFLYLNKPRMQCIWCRTPNLSQDTYCKCLSPRSLQTPFLQIPLDGSSITAMSQETIKALDLKTYRAQDLES